MNAKKLMLTALLSFAVCVVADYSHEMQYEMGRIVASAFERSDAMALVAQAIKDDLNDEGKRAFAGFMPNMAKHISEAKKCILAIRSLEEEINPLEREFKEHLNQDVLQEHLNSLASEEEVQKFISKEIEEFLNREDIKERYPDVSEKIEKLSKLRLECADLDKENNRLYWAFIEGVKSVLGGASLDSYMVEELARHMTDLNKEEVTDLSKKVEFDLAKEVEVDSLLEA